MHYIMYYITIRPSLPRLHAQIHFQIYLKPAISNHVNALHGRYVHKTAQGFGIEEDYSLFRQALSSHQEWLNTAQSHCASHISHLFVREAARTLAIKS